MKKIAVLIGGIVYDSQRRILNGIWEKARKSQADIHVFTCHVNASNGEGGQEGAYRIYEMPDLTAYDGVVLVYNTVYYENPKVARKLVHTIQKKHIPAVSIDRRLDKMACIMLDNYDGIYKMVEHLITVHGKREIYFLGGPEDNSDCFERKRAYLEAMAKHGIEVKPYQVLKGNFAPSTGKWAWDYWTRICGVIPQAVVCINDSMASGIKIELEQQRLRVPEDVILTGVDNNWEAEYGAPRLTTIDRSYYEAGYEACGLLLEAEGAEELETVRMQIPSKLIFSQSCGCHDNVREDIQKIKQELVEERFRTQSVVDSIKGMILDSLNVESFEDFIEMLKRYVGITSSQYFYLCLNQENTKEPRQGSFGVEYTDIMKTENGGYTKDMRVPLACENGMFWSYDRFEGREIIPVNAKRDNQPICYICLPLSFQSQSFGYCVFGNSSFPMDQYLCYTWVLTISSAIQNIRRKDQLNRMVDRLNNMWIYDTLTGLYNRAGFFNFSPGILEAAKEEGQESFVIFMDLDGLKEVNDTQGHEMGDRYICAMAQILKAVARPGEPVMRYGGDEFAILGKNGNYNRAAEIMDELGAAIAEKNSSAEYKFSLSVSMGCQVFDPRKEYNLMELLERADQEMYKQKRGKYDKGH